MVHPTIKDTSMSVAIRVEKRAFSVKGWAAILANTIAKIAPAADSGREMLKEMELKQEHIKLTTIEPIKIQLIPKQRYVDKRPLKTKALTAMAIIAITKPESTPATISFVITGFLFFLGFDKYYPLLESP